MQRRLPATLALLSLGLTYTLLLLISPDRVREPGRAPATDPTQDQAPDSEQSVRLARLAAVCAAEAGPELHPPARPGVETVLLPGNPPVMVCVPHKAINNVDDRK